MKTMNRTKYIIQRGTILFCVAMGICTLAASTIYKNTLPVVTTATINSGIVENKYLMEGTLQKDPILLETQKQAIVATLSGELTFACSNSQDELIEAGNVLYVINEIAKTAKEKEQEAIEASTLEIEEESIARQKDYINREIIRIKNQCSELKQELAQVSTSYKVKNLKVDIENQKKVIDTNKALYEVGGITANECEEAENGLQKMQNELAEYVEEQEKAIQNEIDSQEERILTLKNELIALNEKKAINVKQSETYRQGDAISGSKVITPIEGYFKQNGYFKGQSVNKGDLLGEIIPEQIPYRLVFQLSEDREAIVNIGDKVIWATADRQQKAKVINKQKREDNAYTIVCEVDEEVLEEMELTGNSCKKVEVRVEEKSEQYPYIVSNIAISMEANLYYIYTLDTLKSGLAGKHKVKKVNVNVLEEGDYVTAIEGAIESGEKIIETTNKQLRDGAEVALKEEVN